MRGKILTDTHTVKNSGRSKTPHQGSKEVVRKKESGRKRKVETPSSGSLLKYMKVKNNVNKNNGADIDNGGGGRVVTPIPVSTSIQGINNGVSQECKVEGNSEKSCAINSVKQTFTAAECGTDLNIRKENIFDADTDSVACVFGGGRCVTHNIKLVRSVTKKKMSVVDKLGQIAWRYRDVTCMRCPNKATKKGLKAETINSDVRGK